MGYYLSNMTKRRPERRVTLSARNLWGLRKKGTQDVVLDRGQVAELCSDDVVAKVYSTGLVNFTPIRAKGADHSYILRPGKRISLVVRPGPVIVRRVETDEEVSRMPGPFKGADFLRVLMGG